MTAASTIAVSSLPGPQLRLLPTPEPSRTCRISTCPTETANGLCPTHAAAREAAEERWLDMFQQGRIEPTRPPAFVWQARSGKWLWDCPRCETVHGPYPDSATAAADNTGHNCEPTTTPAVPDNAEWTSVEDVIVDAHKPAAAAALLHRSPKSVRARKAHLLRERQAQPDAATEPATVNVAKQTRRRWTQAEDQIVASSTVAEALTMLSGRTEAAIRQRRITLGLSGTLPRSKHAPTRQWTAAEDDVVQTLPAAEAHHMLPHRTEAAIRQRRKTLNRRHQQQNGTKSRE